MPKVVVETGTFQIVVAFGRRTQRAVLRVGGLDAADAVDRRREQAAGRGEAAAEAAGVEVDVVPGALLEGEASRDVDEVGDRQHHPGGGDAEDRVLEVEVDRVPSGRWRPSDRRAGP